MARRDEKPWGECLHVHADSHVEVDLLKIEAGGYSSIHRHNAKQNLFLLLSGSVDVFVFADEGGGRPLTSDSKPIFIYQLRNGSDVVVVPAGAWHQFRAFESSEIIEVYYAAVPKAEDIERRSSNGRVDTWLTSSGHIPWEL